MLHQWTAPTKVECCSDAVTGDRGRVAVGRREFSRVKTIRVVEIKWKTVEFSSSCSRGLSAHHCSPLDNYCCSEVTHTLLAARLQ